MNRRTKMIDDGFYDGRYRERVVKSKREKNRNNSRHWMNYEDDDLDDSLVPIKDDQLLVEENNDEKK